MYPIKINSNKVLRFSGEGEVTKTLEYPNAMAPAMEIPSAADFPRPLAAVTATVLCTDLSAIA